jgi:polygalacturonase
VIGSEMSGGVRNVFVTDCDFNGTQRGIRMKSRRGRGGVVENIWVNGVRMSNISDAAIFLETNYGAGAVPPRTQEPPTFRGIHISNVTCTSAGHAIEIYGLPDHPIENVTLENINIKARSGARFVDVKDLEQSDVVISTSEQ